jgi:hypothetical protein
MKEEASEWLSPQQPGVNEVLQSAAPSFSSLNIRPHNLWGPITRNSAQTSGDFLFLLPTNLESVGDELKGSRLNTSKDI